MNYKEIEEYALSDFKRKQKELEDWLTRPISEYKHGKGILEHIRK